MYDEEELEEAEQVEAADMETPEDRVLADEFIVYPELLAG